MDRQFSRRQLVQGVGAVGLGLLAGCGRWPGQGQPASSMPRIGFLAPGSREGRAPLLEGFRQGLREWGYVEGDTIVIEYRFSEGNDARLPALAAELVDLRVHVILASAIPATVAAKQATSTIPIVMGGSGDPLATGLVGGLARPGGNVTGMGILASQLMSKRLEMLQEVLPTLTRVSIFTNPTNPIHAPQLAELESAARVLGLQVQRLEVQSPDDFDGAFAAAVMGQADALMVPSDALTTNHRGRLASLAMQYRLPVIYDYREFAEVGGLMAYGPNLRDLYRRAAGYVDKILKGARPADLPVEQPMQFDFIINLTTAHALGLTIPPHVLLQATEVIQ
jgi:putative tryptophan/tyrosine transport system substrate-binding protein